MDTVIHINQPAPSFRLPDLEGKLHQLDDYKGKLVLINFWSAECPWAERADQGLNAAAQKWGEDVVVLCIASNANESVELIEKVSRARDTALILLDKRQQLAQEYGAITTPHIFVIDQQGILQYQGAYDDMTFRKREPTRNYTVEAVNALLENRTPEPQKTPPYGCTIVYGPLSE